MKNYGFFLLPEFSNLCLSLAVEPLRASNLFSPQRAYNWHLLSLDGQPVRSSSGFTFDVDFPLEAGCEAVKFDILFVLASYNYQKYATKEVLQALRNLGRKVPVLAAIDSSSYLLAKAGLLNGHKATIHWEELKHFQELSLDVDVVDQRFVMDSNRLSCAGSATTLDFILEIIRRDYGKVFSQQVAYHFLYTSEQPGDYPQIRLAEGQTKHLSARMQRAFKIIDEHLESPLSITELSDKLRISQRQLEREFKNNIGMNVRQYYLHARIQNARKMIAETSLTLSEIAVRTGFSCQSTLGRAYKKIMGHAPSQDRFQPKLGSRQRQLKRS